LLLWHFLHLFHKERPAVYLGYTVKPNIYGSLAAHLLNVSVINTIEGVGAVFMRHTCLTRLVCRLYRMVLSLSSIVFFLNNDDLTLFVVNKLVSQTAADRLPGIGVDIDRFAPIPLPDKAALRFLLIARMLWDKGIGEFVEAARILKGQGLNAEFCLLGFLD